MNILEDSLKGVDLTNTNEENNENESASAQTTTTTAQARLNDESLDNSNIDYSNESNEHLPRVQVELDKLNYANESINNLELELEDSKREYLKTMYESEEQLASLEKKIGAPVAKAKPYYDARYELNDAKAKYLTAKHRFETAQELYVAAKKMQMYAEENLENHSEKNNNEHNNKNNNNNKEEEMNRETLGKILEIAKIKVNETELSKQSSDIEQIEAFKIYDEKRKKIELMEKELKKPIEKSKKYFELKANLYKELRFLFTKIEGLKSCLKEAKLAYHQSLKNLELISTEIHTQRQTMNMSANINANSSETSIKEFEDTNNNSKINNNNNSKDTKLLSTSLSTLSSTSSSSLSFPKSDNANNSQQVTQAKPVEAQLSDENKNEEDFDNYFNTSINDKIKNDLELKKLNRSLTGSSTPIRTSSNLHLTDEEIENLNLDDKLKKYKDELDNSYRRKTDDDLPNNKSNKNGSTASNNEINNTSKSNSPTNQSNRPQFRVPSVFLSNMNRK